MRCSAYLWPVSIDWPYWSISLEFMSELFASMFKFAVCVSCWNILFLFLLTFVRTSFIKANNFFTMYLFLFSSFVIRSLSCLCVMKHLCSPSESLSEAAQNKGKNKLAHWLLINQMNSHFYIFVPNVHTFLSAFIYAHIYSDSRTYVRNLRTNSTIHSVERSSDFIVWVVSENPNKSQNIYVLLSFSWIVFLRIKFELNNTLKTGFFSRLISIYTNKMKWSVRTVIMKQSFQYTAVDRNCFADFICAVYGITIFMELNLQTQWICCIQ